MRIGKPDITDRAGAVEHRVSIDTLAGPEALWYRLPSERSDLVTERSDAALVALLIPAMMQGENIYCEGTISERLFYNLSGPLQRVLQLVIPRLKPVQIYADSVEEAGERAGGVATGFSGGIDSFCTLKDHYYDDVPDSFKVSHLLFNNVGSHGGGANDKFRERYERLLPVTERLGLPFISVNSNLNAFYKPHKGLNFQQTHTLRNASVALLLQRGIGRFLYASTYSYENAFLGPTYDTAYCDIVTLPMLSTDGLDALSVGSEYTRVVKTLKVTEIEESYKSLDVCVDGSPGVGQCSRCWKCLRTLLTLDVANHLDEYRYVFNLDVYRKKRNRYISSVLLSKNSLLEEIKLFMEEREFTPPLPARAYAYARGPAIERQMLQMARRVVRRVRSARRGR